MARKLPARGKRKTPDAAASLARAARAYAKARYVLRLYVAGITPKSQKAIRSVKAICEEHLPGRYDLEVVDIYQNPEALKEGQVVVAPTLVKKLPLPLRRLIGDMADRDRVLIGLDLRKKQ